MPRFTAFGLTILLAFASAALAVDGVVLVNQSTITNGLTGCPTGGTFPIIICQPGSYRLSGNITVPDANTDAIHITADNVTLDLNGFSLIGPVVCSGFPTITSCSLPGSSGVGILGLARYSIVLNGEIRGMGAHGVFLGTDSRVENVHATNNGLVGIGVGLSSKVSSCRSNFNGQDGINSAHAGSLFSGNTANGNAKNGIISDCISLIEGNIAIDNGTSNIASSKTSCVLVNNAAP